MRYNKFKTTLPYRHRQYRFTITTASYGFLTSEVGTDRLSLNVGKKLPLLAA